MVTLKAADPEPMPDDSEVSSTVYSATTPPEHLAEDDLEDEDPLIDHQLTTTRLYVPWPGSVFIIRSASLGQVLTLVDGHVVLANAASASARGSMHWACIETKGWLGFRNTVSGKLLGHNARGFLCCTAERQQGWENFCVRVRPDGACVLLMTHWERLWHVGVKVEQGVERLAKLDDGGGAGLAWEFVKT